VDFERLYGEFDRFRYKAEKLREELRRQVIMLSMLHERILGRSKYLVLKYLNSGIIDLDHIVHPDMYALARAKFAMYTIAKRDRTPVRSLAKKMAGRRRGLTGAVLSLSYEEALHGR